MMGWEEEVSAIVSEHVTVARPLEIDGNRAWWEANTSGSAEAFARKEKTQNRLDAVYADRPFFLRVDKAFAAMPPDAAPQLRRQLTLVRLLRLEKQVPPELLRAIAAKSNAVEQAFNLFRPKIRGEEWTDSRVRRVLRTSGDESERAAAWAASKEVGVVVKNDLLDLVRLRNEAARKAGYPHFQAMALAGNEQEPAVIDRLFDELDALTREPFLATKAEIDAELRERFGVKDLAPWHYTDTFFQEAPAAKGEDLDAPYRDIDILRLCRDYYTGVALPVDDVLSRSDLVERAGKSPHAFCTDIDRAGDVRILANIVPTEYWMATMLHELGHAVYSSKNIPRELPYLLRTEAHTLTTEGIAMLFQRWAKSGRWLAKMGVTVDAQAYEAAGARSRRRELLVFSRWCQVMYRFEKFLYEDPERDLNAAWWDLVERYQGLTRPERRGAADYAAKIHVCSAPVYYHNYLMGELFASQVLRAMARELQGREKFAVEEAVGDKRVGAFLNARVFAPGKTLPWNELTRFATGAPLGAEAFAADFRG